MTMLRDAVARDMSEADLMANVIARATQAGWRVMHINDGLYKLAAKEGRQDAMAGARGFPDLVLAREGVVIFAELKATRGKLAADQSDWLYALRAQRHDASHHVAVWRPAHLFDGTIDDALGGAS
ncbi:MAG TPA: hypothetical protein PK593_00070 [Thermomicrobiales bacterium]|nr:hypothetical protein [Thermomicrobiales bacterium]HQZ90494.1 hypothetical protein [Thermomicrobiales bacterium]HRA32552.1 hypothetical protein [Thermomicrobiales bacterium]